MDVKEFEEELGDVKKILTSEDGEAKPEMTVQEALQVIYDKLTRKNEFARFDNCIIRVSEILKIDCVSINLGNKQILANAQCASGKYPQIVINY